MTVYNQTFAQRQRKIKKEVHRQVVRDQMLDFVLWLDSNQYDSGKLYMDHSHSGKESLRYWRISDTTFAYILRKEKGILNLNNGQAYGLNGEYLYGNHAARLRHYREKQVRMEDDFGIYETSADKRSFQDYKDYLPKQIAPGKTIAYLIKVNHFVDKNGIAFDDYDTITTLQTFDDQKRLIEEEKRFSFDNRFYHSKIEYVNDTVIETFLNENRTVYTGVGLAVSRKAYDVLKTHISKDTLGQDIQTRKYIYQSSDTHFSESMETTTIQRGDASLVYTFEKKNTLKFSNWSDVHNSETKVVYRWKKWGPKR